MNRERSLSTTLTQLSPSALREPRLAKPFIAKKEERRCIRYFHWEAFGEDALDSESEGANAGQLSNRQVVIMMAGLLDISLSPDFTNQKQLAQFLSRLTGRSKESIRQTIMQLAKDGIETPQARKDSIVAADVLEPVCKRVAGRLRNDAEE